LEPNRSGRGSPGGASGGTPNSEIADLARFRRRKRTRSAISRGASLIEGGPSSALEVDEVLQQLVGGGDDAAVRLEAALGDDQAGELLGEVDVGHLQRTGVE